MLENERQAGVDIENEIKVTPEMIKAGVHQLVSRDPAYEDPSEIVEHIYKVMRKLDRRPT